MCSIQGLSDGVSERKKGPEVAWTGVKACPEMRKEDEVPLPTVTAHANSIAGTSCGGYSTRSSAGTGGRVVNVTVVNVTISIPLGPMIIIIVS